MVGHGHCPLAEPCGQWFDEQGALLGMAAHVSISALVSFAGFVRISDGTTSLADVVEQVKPSAAGRGHREPSFISSAMRSEKTRTRSE